MCYIAQIPNYLLNKFTLKLIQGVYHFPLDVKSNVVERWHSIIFGVGKRELLWSFLGIENRSFIHIIVYMSKNSIGLPLIMIGFLF